MEKTKFICQRYKELKVTVVPTRDLLQPGGAIITVPGKMVQFNNGLLETDDPQVIKRVRSMAIFGSSITELTPEMQKKIAKNIEIDKKYDKLKQEELEAEDKKDTKSKK